MEDGEEGADVDAASPLATEVEEEEVVPGEEEEEEEEAETGGTAKVAISIEGGPYDGSVFEISVEEDGDARLIGRSTGKKVRCVCVCSGGKGAKVRVRERCPPSLPPPAEGP